MKPIPTIEELVETARRDSKHCTYFVKEQQFNDSLTAPLFAAIQERDAEIEKLRREIETIRDHTEAATIKKLFVSTQPEPAKPETFEAHGKVWTRHKPGDPMPVDGETLPAVLLGSGSIIENQKASRLKWGVMATNPGQEIIGYRLADEAKPDPYAHLREAQGKVIQYNCGSDDAPEWEDVPIPTYADSPDKYRVKPWELPPPPEGKQWHRVDWTEEMLPEGWRPLLLGEKRQKGDEYQCQGDTVWGPCQVFAEPSTMSGEFYRTRRPLPEPQTWVDLEPEDVPPGSIFRFGKSEKAGYATASLVDFDGVVFASRKEKGLSPLVNWTELSKDWQINRSISKGKWDPNAWEDCKKLKV